MRVARWKVMAGGLLLSAGGLMAVADGPTPLPALPPAPGLPPVAPAVPKLSVDPPVAVPAPAVADLPSLPPPAKPEPAPNKPEPTFVLGKAPVRPAEVAPMPRSAAGFIDTNGRLHAQVGYEPGFTKLAPAAPTGVLTDPPGTRHVRSETRLLKLDQPTSEFTVKVTKPGHTAISGFVTKDGKTFATAPDGSIVGEAVPLVPKPTAVAASPPGPAPTVTFGGPPPSLTPGQRTAVQHGFDVSPAPAVADPAPVNEVNEGKPAPAVVPAAAPAPAVPAERPQVLDTPKPAPKPEPAPASAGEKRLKVVLHMGDDRPRFEVRDGDEVYLKVASDRVEVKSATDPAGAATMKAAGKVQFVTPGGDGTCDELSILPGSGQVVATGGVQFRHTWGRSETTVTAERMTFRLNHAGPTSIQAAGYTPVK